MAIGVVFMGMVFETSLTYAMRYLIDAFSDPDSSAIHWALTYVVLYIIMAICWRSSGYIGMHWVTKSQALAIETLYHWLSQHSSRYYSDHFAGSLATKVTNAGSGISMIVPRLLWNFYPTFLGLFMSVGLMYTASPVLAGILLLWSIIFLALNSWWMRHKVDLSIQAADAFTDLKGQIVDILNNIRTVHQFARLSRERTRVQSFVRDHQQKGIQSWYYSEGVLLINNVLQAVLLAGMFLGATYLYEKGHLSIGEVVMVTHLTWGIMESLFFIGNDLNGLMENYGQVSQGLQLILEEHEITDQDPPESLKLNKAGIDFKKVGFAYPGTQAVFANFNLHIPAGQKIGLVGRSGAGKSTLVQLLLRMYDIQDGEILIDGQNIARVTQNSLRQSICFVPQTSMLFHRSLADNILYGNPEASSEELALAARHAGAAEFIEKQPEQYETLVGERGVKLSGGQTQRICIARAMLKEAPILILDEATSALDSESELIVQDALNELIKQKTVIAIAHRLSTLRMMDRIVVIDEGKIVQDGTHQELLNQEGIYSYLWKHQAGGFLGGDLDKEVKTAPSN